MEKFFIIWNPQGSNPQIKQPTMDKAKKEAERLASLHPGQEFHVLVSCATVMANKISWEGHR